MELEKFNYAAGCYYPKSEEVCTYAYGNEVFYGTIKQAETFLKYVKGQSPEKDWKIFKLVEVV